MLVRRIGSSVLVSFDNKEKAKSFFAFMKKRSSHAMFVESEE